MCVRKETSKVSASAGLSKLVFPLVMLSIWPEDPFAMCYAMQEVPLIMRSGWREDRWAYFSHTRGVAHGDRILLLWATHYQGPAEAQILLVTLCT